MRTDATGPCCVRCAGLRRRLTDPATPSPGAILYLWATHRLCDHQDTPGPRPGCPDCKRWARGPVAVRADIWDRWARTHFMKCALVHAEQPASTAQAAHPQRSRAHMPDGHDTGHEGLARKPDPQAPTAGQQAADDQDAAFMNEYRETYE